MNDQVSVRVKGPVARPLAKSIVAVVVAAALASTALTGCETIERETGIGKEAQTGAVAGAAAGGILAALFKANPAWIAASVILGAVAGGYLADYLTEKDAEMHGASNYKALDTLGPGQRTSWSNPNTGNSGSTVVTEAFEMADATLCKNFTETINYDNETVTRHSTACKAPGGDWKIRGA